MKIPAPKPRIAHIAEVAVLSTILVGIGIVLLILRNSSPSISAGRPFASSGASVASTPTVNSTTLPNPDPTPPPTVVLPKMTPVPYLSGDQLEQKEQLQQSLPTSLPMPTSLPSDPVNVTIEGDGYPNTFISYQESSLIVRGVIRSVGAPRWTTPDGRRPANPRVPRIEFSIYRPVTLYVEQFLKGQSSQKNLPLYAFGGKIGQDSFTRYPQYLYSFHEGEEVILFLSEIPLPVNGHQLWDVKEHYSVVPGPSQQGVASGEQAKNDYLTVQLNQLLSDIRAAQQP